MFLKVIKLLHLNHVIGCRSWLKLTTCPPCSVSPMLHVDIVLDLHLLLSGPRIIDLSLQSFRGLRSPVATAAISLSLSTFLEQN